MVKKRKCDVTELAESLHNGNRSYVRGELNACSNVDVLEFVEEYARFVGGSDPLKKSMRDTRRLLDY